MAMKTDWSMARGIASGRASRLVGDDVNGLQANGETPALLLVDDESSVEKLAPDLTARGLRVEAAHTTAHAVDLARRDTFRYAITALRLPDASGLRLVRALLAIDPTIRVVVLTGYPSIQTAVEAIKLGAVYYLAKPASADQLIAALHRDQGDPGVPLGDKPMSMHRLAWEYMSQVLHENNGNISATARALAIHRRTLQRKLRKRPVSA
jgi:two-component system response regulator RegA